MGELKLDINIVPDADMISQRIFSVVNVGDIEQQMIRNVLNDWNDEWVNFVAIAKTGVSDSSDDNRRRDNAMRLRKRIERLEELRDGAIPLKLREDTV